MPKFDFTNADEKGGDFTPLPKGNYPFEIESIDDERETSENAQKFPNAPMTSIQFTCLDSEYENRRVWLNLIFPEGDDEDAKKQRARSAGRVKKLCRASGAWEEDELESDDFELDWDDLDGAKFTLKLTEQKGGSGNNIVDILPFDDADEDELP